MAEALAIPHPRPSDVGSPIPGEAEQADLFAQLEAAQGAAAPAATPSPTPSASTPPAPEAVAPAPVSPQDLAAAGAKPITPTANVPAVDDLFAQLDAFSQDEKIKNAPTKEGGEGAPVFARLMANIGKEPEVQRQLLQRTLGLDYDTKVEKDAVWFRKKGEEFFLRMDPEEWSGVGEFLKDMTVDIAPDIAESLVASTITAIAARSGAAVAGIAGTASGGPGAGMVAAGAGYVGGYAVGLPLGGALAAQGRSSLISALGVPNEVDLKKEAAINSLATLTGMVGMQAIRRPAAAILDRVASALGNTKFARVAQMAKVREGIEEFSKEAGLPIPSKAVAPNAALGQQVESILDMQEAKLGKQVGLVRTKAQQVAGNNALPVTKFQERAKEILTNEGVQFDPQKGFATLPADYAKLKPFGDESGSVLKQVVDDYNMSLRGNGMKMNQIFNNLDFYKNEAGYQKNLPDAANGVYQRLRGALREDRDAALMQVLPENSAERKFATTAFGEFKDNIDEVRKLQKLANKSPEKFADSLIAPKESGRVLQLKQVLGHDSEAFSNVKSAWYSKIVQKSVDPETGIVVGANLKKELDKYGPDVLNELMTPAQQNTIRALASRGEKIAYTDLIDNPGGNAFFKDLVRANISGVSTTEAKVRVLWSMFGSNKKVVKYLTNDGLLDLAKEIKDPQARSTTLKAAEWMAKIARVSEVKTTSKGVEILKPPFDVGVMGGLINAMEQQVDESMPDYLQRRKTQLNELRQNEGLPIDNKDEQ